MTILRSFQENENFEKLLRSNNLHDYLEIYKTGLNYQENAESDIFSDISEDPAEIFERIEDLQKQVDKLEYTIENLQAKLDDASVLVENAINNISSFTEHSDIKSALNYILNQLA